MNFRDLYKHANDNIHGDRNLIDALYEKSDSKIQFNMRIASICAASLLVIVALGAFPRLYTGEKISNSSDTHHERKITYKDAKQPSENTEQNAVTESKKEFTDINTPKTTEKFVMKDITSDSNHQKTNIQEDASLEKKAGNVIENGESAALNTDKIEEINPNSTRDATANATNDKSSVADSGKKAPIYTDAESDEGNIIKSSGTARTSGGGGASAFSGSSAGGAGGGSVSGGASSGSNTGTTVEHMSLSSYVQYLGIDLSAFNYKLPDGMKIIFPDSVSVTKNIQNGNYIDDAVTFVALDENAPAKFLGITTTKLDTEFKTIFDRTDKSLINGCEVALLRNDNSANAYFKYKGVWISITSVDVSNREFDSFIKNMIK